MGRVPNGFPLFGFVSGEEEIAISAPDGESVLGMVRRLAVENGLFRKVIFDGENKKIQRNIVVILSGRIVNPYERSENTLEEGDEVTFLPMLYGG